MKPSKPILFAGIVLIGSSLGSLSPVRAEGFFEALFGGGMRPVAPVQVQPAWDPFDQPDIRVVPRLRRSPRHRASLPPTKPPTSAKANAAKAGEKASDPVVALLQDETLRPGDIAVFPDGPRAFQGEPGGHHSMRDFVKVSQAEGLSKASRKALLAIRVTPAGWSTQRVATSAKLADVRDVNATGAIAKKASP